MLVSTSAEADSGAVADAILEVFKKHQLSGKPSNYALLFEAAMGDRGLGEIISAALQEPCAARQDKLDEIYDLLILPTRLSEQLFSLADKLIEQAQYALDLLDEAASGAGGSREALQRIRNEIPQSRRRDLKGVISALIEHAHQMRMRSRNLLAGFESHRRTLDGIQSDIASIIKGSRTDALTGLSNRRSFEKMLQSVVEGAQRGGAISLLLIDVDHFKSVNDRFGHLVGDQVLAFVGKTISRSIMAQDLAARYGGEEFAVILPETGLDGAITVAERIRMAIARPKLVRQSTGEQVEGVTASIGVATLENEEAADAFFARADKNLYEAKRLGRNKVVARPQGFVERASPAFRVERPPPHSSRVARGSESVGTTRP